MTKKRGDYVQTWFDTGAMGATILYGRVVSAGPRTYLVRWESGIQNRVTQEYPHVTAAHDTEAAAAACNR
jgi:hypothetical protein